MNGRVTAVMYCPVGVDAERVGRDMSVSFPFLLSFVYRSNNLCGFFYRKRPGIIPKLEALRTLYEGKKIIVGRDKLEVVKGVLQKVSSPSLSSILSFF